MRRRNRGRQPQPIRGWQPQPIMALRAILRLTDLFAADMIMKMTEVDDLPGHSLSTRRKLNPGEKGKSSFLDGLSLVIIVPASHKGSFFSSFLNWGWQPQPIMALRAILQLTELFAAGVKTLSTGHLPLTPTLTPILKK